MPDGERIGARGLPPLGEADLLQEQARPRLDEGQEWLLHREKSGHDVEAAAKDADELWGERPIRDRFAHVGHGGGDMLQMATILGDCHVTMHHRAEVGTDVNGAAGGVVAE